MKTHYVAAIAATCCIGLLPISAMGQSFPEEPVQLIVPWSPGGGSDTLMRIVSGHVEPYLGVNMPVVNMPGVSGTRGLEELAEREPNGYTLGQVHDGLLVSHHTGITEINWDDFEPISAMVSSPQFLVVNADRPYDTFEEFVDFAKDNPGEIRMGVTLAGVPHVHAAMIEDAAGIEFSYVGYEGTGERIRALVGGHIDAAIGDIASSYEFVRNGDLRFLATGNPERLEQTPDVPTFKELGHEQLELTITRGIVAPEGTPEERITVVESALGDLAKDEEFIEAVNNAGARVRYLDSDGFASLLDRVDGTISNLADKLER